MSTVKIPNTVICDKELSLNELGLAYVLYSLADENGEITENADVIVKLAKCSKSTFYKYLNSLKEKNIVKSEQLHKDGRFSKGILTLIEV